MTAEQFEMLLQMAVIAQPPYLLAGLGLLMEFSVASRSPAWFS